jgi:hypothetical protein
MARTTESDVRAVVDTALPGTTIIRFINQAHRLVQDAIVTPGADYGSERLRDIETYLAAHLVALRDPLVTSEKLGDASRTYLVPTGQQGLAATPYGQMAMTHDHLGYLAGCSALKGRASLEAYPDDAD